MWRQVHVNAIFFLEDLFTALSWSYWAWTWNSIINELFCSETLKPTSSSVRALRPLARQQERCTTAEVGLLLRRLSMRSCQCLHKAPISIIDKALIKPRLHLASQMPHHQGQIASRTEPPHHAARCELATWPWGQHMAKVEPINELYSDYHKCGI